MNDGIIKGEGNSRYLKTVADAMTRYPTHEALMQALIEGTFPVDFNGINSAGWKKIGTPMDKANVLTDETAKKLQLPGNPSPNDAFGKLFDIVNGLSQISHRIAAGTYAGTGTATNTIEIGFTPKVLIVSPIDNMIDFPTSSSSAYGYIRIFYVGQPSEIAYNYSAISQEVTRKYTTTATGITIKAVSTGHDAADSHTLYKYAANIGFGAKYYWAAIG